MTRQELHVLGCRIKALGSTRGDLLDYIEGTLPLLTMMPQIVVAPKAELAKVQAECPVCAERRRQKAQAQKNWRRQKGQKK